VTKNRVLDELRAVERRPRAVVDIETCRRSRCSTPRSSGSRRSTRYGARSSSSMSTQDGVAAPGHRRLSYTEIADSLEVTLATVKWRIYKAREDVQLALAREGIVFYADEPAQAEPAPALSAPIVTG